MHLQYLRSDKTQSMKQCGSRLLLPAVLEAGVQAARRRERRWLKLLRMKLYVGRVGFRCRRYAEHVGGTSRFQCEELLGAHVAECVEQRLAIRGERRNERMVQVSGGRDSGEGHSGSRGRVEQSFRMTGRSLLSDVELRGRRRVLKVQLWLQLRREKVWRLSLMVRLSVHERRGREECDGSHSLGGDLLAVVKSGLGCLWELRLWLWPRLSWSSVLLFLLLRWFDCECLCSSWCSLLARLSDLRVDFSRGHALALQVVVHLLDEQIGGGRRR